MKIRIDGIATVWLQKRGLPTKRGSTAEEYKAKVEAYLLANPKDWPYYNREGRLDPFGGATPPTRDEPNTAKRWDEEPAHVAIQKRIENEQSHQENPPSLPQHEPQDRQVPQAVESPKKVHYVIVRESRLGFREFLKVLAYQDQKEDEKWSSDPSWADRFLAPDGAEKFAKRILGHENFRVEPL